MTQDVKGRKKFLNAPMLSKSIDEEGNVIPRYRFTSESMDEGGDIIKREATEKAVEKWRKWRNIRLQHDPFKPVGKAVAIGEEDGLEWNEMDVRIDDPTVKPLIEGDDPVLGAASVGIIVNDFEVNEDEEAQERAGFWEPWIITDYDLVEISLVDHPMNYDATLVSEEGRGKVLMRRRDISEVDMPEEVKKEAGAEPVEEEVVEEPVAEEDVEEPVAEEGVEDPVAEEESGAEETETQEVEAEEEKSVAELLDRNLDATRQLGETISDKLDLLIDAVSGEEETVEESVAEEASGESGVESEAVEEAEVEEGVAEEVTKEMVEDKQFSAEEVAELVVERVREAIADSKPEEEQEAKELAQDGISEERVRELIQEEIAKAKQLKPRKTKVVEEVEVEEVEEEKQADEPADPREKLRAVVSGLVN